ncbi:MAG TPA: hypothetical protein PK711_06235 [Bacteroidales bacterium]|nr:hypothetical protein [Bacteroidales bacterium]
MACIRYCLILSLCLALPALLCAQQSIRDSVLVIPTLRATAGFDIPSGDLAEQFGPHFTTGAEFFVKTRKNFLVGLEGNYLFGGTVKNEEQVLGPLLTDKGWVIDKYGTPADLFLYERGFTVFLRLGKVFPVIGPNPNSGIHFTVGGGYLQHKIRIENIEGTVPQVTGDYKKGWDKLSGGFAITEFLGYIHYSNNKRINFFAGLDLQQGWTSPMRPYDFNLMGKDTSGNLALFWGVKAGWMISFSSRSSDGNYYY